MKNIPQHLSPEEYARMAFLFDGQPPEPGVKLQSLPGPISVLGVHLHDGGGEFMRRMVRETEAVCAAIGDRLANIILIQAEQPPASLAGRPETELFTDFDMANDRFADLLLAQQRIVMVGWDARACVAQTLHAVAALLPDAEAELHFPLGALADQKLEDAPSAEDAAVLITTLIGSYARNIQRLRGMTDVSYNGVYLARHGEGAPATRLHFHGSSAELARHLTETA